MIGKYKTELSFFIALCPVMWTNPVMADSASPIQVVVQQGVSTVEVPGGTKTNLKVGPLSKGGSFRVMAKGYTKLLLSGGCVVRAHGGSVFNLQTSGKPGVCASVSVFSGRVQVAAPRRKEIAVISGDLKARVTGGAARIWGGKLPKICALATGVRVGGAGAKAPSTDEAKQPPPPASAPPMKKWAELQASRCVVSQKGLKGMEEVTWARAAASAPNGVPEVDVDLEPVLPARKKKGKQGKKGSGSDSVSAGAGGSMCLDSSGSGSGASSVQQGPSGIQKPPPKTRLKIRVVLPWKR